MAEVYYDRATKSAVPALRYDPLNPMHVELDPSHIFFQTMPPGHEFTYDLNDVPNGTQPIPVDPVQAIREDLWAAGITQSKITVELFKDSQALPNTLAGMYSTIQAIAIAHTTTEEAVINALG